MAQRPLVEVVGARELRRQMREAGVDLQMMRDAHKSVATVVANAARGRAPKASGQMAATIRPAGTLSAAIVRAGYKSRPYAGPNNWGWPAAPGGIAGEFRGNFWMQDAARGTQATWVNVYATEVQHIVDKVKGRRG